MNFKALIGACLILGVVVAESPTELLEPCAKYLSDHENFISSIGLKSFIDKIYAIYPNLKDHTEINEADWAHLPDRACHKFYIFEFSLKNDPYVDHCLDVLKRAEHHITELLDEAFLVCEFILPAKDFGKSLLACSKKLSQELEDIPIPESVVLMTKTLGDDFTDAYQEEDCERFEEQVAAAFIKIIKQYREDCGGILDGTNDLNMIDLILGKSHPLLEALGACTLMH